MLFRASQTASLMPRRSLRSIAIAIFFIVPTVASAAAGESHHTFGPIFLALALLVLAAKLGGLIAQRWGQPAVLAELLVGIRLANLVPLLMGGDGIAFVIEPDVEGFGRAWSPHTSFRRRPGIGLESARAGGSFINLGCVDRCRDPVRSRSRFAFLAPAYRFLSDPRFRRSDSDGNQRRDHCTGFERSRCDRQPRGSDHHRCRHPGRYLGPNGVGGGHRNRHCSRR